MASCINAKNANEAWLQALELLRQSPEAREVQSRNGMTTELLHVVITLLDPRQRWVYARQPVISPAFALAEAIWIICGRNDSEVLNFLNKDLPKFAGEGPTYYGAYGHRLRHQHGIDQLDAAYKALTSNPGSRQVVLQIWDPETDHPGESGEPRSRDIPCNTQAILRVQDGKLFWLQIMRSNDIFRGLPYNLVQFTTLHEVMAGWLGLELGSYTHMVSSLHLYNHDLDALTGSTACVPIANPDDLRLPKNESDRCFATLDTLLTQISLVESDVAALGKTIHQAKLPLPYLSVGLTLLAEAARRRKDAGLANDLIGQVTNPCLSSVAKRWFSRTTSSESFKNE